MTRRWRPLLAAVLFCLVSGAAAAQTRSSEVGFDNDPVNQQTHGYGVRAAFLAETRTGWGDIAFGPFFRYWNVGRSQNATLSLGGTPAFTVFEPANNTVEAGATLRWQF